MRIALVHSRYSGAVPSGENAVVDAEYDALRTAGVDVALFQTDPEKVRSGRTYPLRAALRVATGRGPDFASDLEAFAPDLVHVHNAFPDLGERDLGGLDRPLVLTAHNYRSFCANGYAFRDGGTCVDCVSRLGGSWNGVLHGCYRSRLASVPLAVRNQGGSAGNPLIRRAESVMVPSEQARRVLVSAGAPSSRILVSPHFLPDALLPPPGERPARGDHYAFVGRLTAEKGLDALLTNWPAGRGLVVVGEGDDQARLSSTYGSTDIRFLGGVPRRDVLEVLSGARALVFPSLWWETFGLVAMEALAVGTPVLSVGQHAVADLVRQHGVGSAIEDSAKVGSAIAAIEAVSPGEWQERVSEVFERHFTQKKWLTRRLDEYAAVLSRVGLPTE
jgi:glycosyltransferase involved in cell wall biosynthesis